MKTWNVPAMEELNVELTANGYFDTYFETLFIHNDSENNFKPTCPNPPATDDDSSKNDSDKNS